MPADVLDAMRWLRTFCVLLLPFLAGCGRQLEGVYECSPIIPRIELPIGSQQSNQPQRLMDDALRNLERLQRTTLEFRGSKAWLGSAAGTVEYSYKLAGNRLELIGNVSGQAVSISMEIRDDGSIMYLGMAFKRIK